MNEFTLFPVTFSIIAITVLTTLLGFNSQDIRSKALFYPYQMTGPSQYYRFFSHGLIHADYVHLFFNMFTLYSFGRVVEIFLFTKTEYVILYVSALAASSIFDFFRNRKNYNYAALGASGAVSAVVFATLIFDPWEKGIALFGLPFLAIPNILFAILYIWFCAYMDKRGKDNIGHNAHLWGSVYGFLLTAVLKPDLFKSFIDKLMHPHF
ncbi:rhomboid family intramembrane serine protease [Ferruginibacter sp. SUN002]|uniref:rhomboid family intramembrane serine protease n=1 Tax=Ferruginibacter sp. SUN002 TaxID=2937789 RepID=UPI003D35C920